MGLVVSDSVSTLWTICKPYSGSTSFQNVTTVLIPISSVEVRDKVHYVRNSKTNTEEMKGSFVLVQQGSGSVKSHFQK